MDKAENMFDGMRRMLASVTIVTANNARGERFAMTASSVTSVSGEPQSLLVCVNKKAGLDHAIEESKHFCISVLSPKHKQIAVNCATPELENRFEHGNWHQHDDTGLHFLADAEAVFFCQKQLTQEYGTHHVYIADVIETRVSQEQVNPLGYLDGDYLRLG